MPSNATLDDRVNSFYYAFLQRFRQSESSIKELFARYVDLCRNRGLVIDLACGRGEFLELMKDAGIDAYGVDLNPGMISVCRSKALTVIREDWKEHLSKQQNDRFGVVFCAQFVEHLEFTELIEFFSVSYDKLKPGGVLIVETLTPCLNTLLEKFWVDLTHRSPLNPVVLTFVANFSGFSKVEVEYYNELPDDKALEELPAGKLDSGLLEISNRNVNRLNQLLFLPHYYALRCWKPDLVEVK